MVRLVFIKQDIRRFDVAMDYAFLVSVIKSDTNGCEELNDIGGRWKLSHARRVTDVLGKGHPLDIIHDYVGKSALLFRRACKVKFIDPHNVRILPSTAHFFSISKPHHQMRTIS